MTNYNKFIFKIPPPPKFKITLQKVHKFNRIYSDSKTNRVDIYENNDKFYLVFKGKILTYTDQDKCFEEAKRISEKGRLSDNERPDS